MGVNSLPKTVTRQRRDCELNPGPSAPESSTLTTRLPSHLHKVILTRNYYYRAALPWVAVCCQAASHARSAKITRPIATDVAWSVSVCL